VVEVRQALVSLVVMPLLLVQEFLLTPFLLVLEVLLVCSVDRVFVQKLLLHDLCSDIRLLTFTFVTRSTFSSLLFRQSVASQSDSFAWRVNNNCIQE